MPDDVIHLNRGSDTRLAAAHAARKGCGVGIFPEGYYPRKRLVEIQYLHTTIAEEQQQEFGQLVESTIRQIESAQFLPHSGIRFPQNPCASCRYIGLCLGKPELIEAALIRRPGAENLAWLDELSY